MVNVIHHAKILSLVQIRPQGYVCVGEQWFKIISTNIIVAGSWKESTETVIDVSERWRDLI